MNINDSIKSLSEQVHALQERASAIPIPEYGWTGDPSENETRCVICDVLDDAASIDSDLVDVAKSLRAFIKEIQALRKETETLSKSLHKAEREARSAVAHRQADLERAERHRVWLERLHTPAKTKDIYIIRNDLNDMAYVGQSVDPEKRFTGHKSAAMTNFGNEGSLADAIRSIGIEHFWVEILEKDVPNYDEREAYWIKELNTLYPNGYNQTSGGRKAGTFIMSTVKMNKNRNEEIHDATEQVPANTSHE